MCWEVKKHLKFEQRRHEQIKLRSKLSSFQIYESVSMPQKLTCKKTFLLNYGASDNMNQITLNKNTQYKSGPFVNFIFHCLFLKFCCFVSFPLPYYNFHLS